MPSRVLYDTRTNEILRCQPEPFGSAGMPSFEALCWSARVPDDEREYMATADIEGTALTTEARQRYRIVDGEVEFKPRLTISTDKPTVIIEEDAQLLVSVAITRTIDTDSFIEVDIEIEGLPLTVELTENEGDVLLELTDPGDYQITCSDNRFVVYPAHVEAI